MFKPTTFGKFYLYEKLAIGGMAEIFKAKLYGIAGFEKTLVVKQILPEYAADNEFVKMFIDEANIAVSLTHGNIVPVYELGKIGERYYIAMEFVDGENLETIIDEVVKLRQEIPVEKAVEISIEVLKGLDYAHRKQGADGQSLGIVHRDVSPQNVMVSFDGEVKIVDFGIAKAASKLSLTRVGTLKGKFGYMSPEQALGSDVDRRTDVYAAAIVLWEVLTGKRLYDAESDIELLKRVRAGAAPPPRQINARVPEALDRIVMRGLARDVGERYQEAAQFQIDLQRWLYSRPEDPAEDSLANWMRRLFRREMHARAPSPPPFAEPPPPPKPEPGRGARRDVSYARNSEILRVLEQAEEAATLGAEATTSGPEPSNSGTGETAETEPVDETRSRSVSGDFLSAPTATGTATASPLMADDLVLDWDETSDKVIMRRPSEGEYVERSFDKDGPVIRVPTIGRRRGGDVPAPWNVGPVPARDSRDEETRPPPPRQPPQDRRGMASAPPPGAPPIGEITGDTRKPSNLNLNRPTTDLEPPLFEDRRPSSSRPYLIGVGLFLFAALLGGLAIAAASFLGGGTEAVTSTPKPSPTITSFANNTATPTRTSTRTPTPAPTATATAEPTAAPTKVAVVSERKATFDTIPSGANVFLGTKLLGRTPLSSATVPAGEDVTIRYAKQGYRDLKETYPSGSDTLKASERLEVVAVNTPVPATGKISVQSTPWGEVSIDGVKIKNTPLLGHAVKVGTRKVSVFCPSLKKTETRIVVVRANEELDPLIFNFE